MNLEIIIIDDDDIVVFLHKFYLSESFPTSNLQSFNSAESAISYLSSQTDTSTEYLVLTDINMPRMSGWDFIDTIQHQPVYNQMSIVMVSSSIDERDRFKASTYSRVIDFFEKPISAELCSKLKQMPDLNLLL